MKVKGWAVLTKSEYYDWSISQIYTKDSNSKPKTNCQEWVKELERKFPETFKFKIKPCEVLLRR